MRRNEDGTGTMELQIVSLGGVTPGEVEVSTEGMRIQNGYFMIEERDHSIHLLGDERNVVVGFDFDEDGWPYFIVKNPIVPENFKWLLEDTVFYEVETSSR